VRLDSLTYSSAAALCDGNKSTHKLLLPAVQHGSILHGMKHVRIFTVAILLATPLLAQARKEAWLLSVDERIALRTNPDLARERVKAGKQVQTHKLSSMSIADSFDGKTRPELFLPSQVFDELLNMAFLSNPRASFVVQQGLSSEVKKHGLPTDFFDRLRVLSTVHIADALAERDLGQGLARQRGAATERQVRGLELKRADVCRSRAEALAAARKEFGTEKFDRFLYEAIAAHMFSLSDKLPDANVLRRIEGGCR
jgi:hypothetical protein